MSMSTCKAQFDSEQQTSIMLIALGKDAAKEGEEGGARFKGRKIWGKGWG